MTTAEWRLSGACCNADSELFFDEDDHSPATLAAKAICADCPVFRECRSFALHPENPELEGLWAGMTESERADRRRKLA